MIDNVSEDSSQNNDDNVQERGCCCQPHHLSSDTGDDYTSLDGIVFSDSAGYDQTCENAGTYEYCIGDTLKGGSQYDGNYEVYANFFSESDNCSARKALLEAGEKVWFKKL